jgi:hypothetical protein
MDWKPLIYGALVGVGDGVVDRYAPTTGFFGRHRGILYQGAAFLAGAWGELTGNLSPDLSYGLMVGGLSLAMEDLAYGGIPGALGATAYSPAYPPYALTEVVTPASVEPPAWHRPVYIRPDTQPATAAG